MKNKKSFILHYDSLNVIDEMTDEQVWKLLRKMKSYHNWNTYECDDQIANIVFIQFKNQFDRDIEKYEKTCSRNKEIASKRWDKKSTKSTTRTKSIPKSTKSTYNDSDNDNDNDSDSDSKKKKRGEYKNVLISDKDMKELISTHSKEKVVEYVKKVDEYCEQTWKKYKNYKIVINKWILKDSGSDWNKPKKGIWSWYDDFGNKFEEYPMLV